MTKPTRAEQEKILAMPSEDYINPVQQDYFRRLIRHEKQGVLDHILCLGMLPDIQSTKGDGGGELLSWVGMEQIDL
ncbi:C4-type zinc finger protein, DksA/TraR family [Klebsiella pneumoniae subsp. ozaenae]|uniref:C4-type zinc finger protein, DksA/TraR family n=1 Tax=Klebsiella pneumoniae subsp. ozaenae TaxID=574 RepID=A0A377YUK3_KLEPO|nr:C4-type zinc finger protein, DksA/TraR family [Klebsiella pneumoniae subsp. ozaenae]